MLDSLTVNQLRIFVSVVETGSFSGAARQLVRAQSAISHAIDRIEDDLQLKLFDRSAKRPVLTEAGKGLIGSARAIVAQVDDFREQGRAFAEGLEPEVALAVSLLAPLDPLVGVLAEFENAFPTVTLQLDVQEVGVPVENVLAGKADIAITGAPILSTPKGRELARYPLGAVPMVAVASPRHPLAKRAGPLRESDVKSFRQLIPTSGRVVTYRHVHTDSVWRISDQAARAALLRAGLGWGFTPRHSVDADIRQGNLVALDVAFRHDLDGLEALFAVHRKERRLGPAGARLVELLQEAW